MTPWASRPPSTERSGFRRRPPTRACRGRLVPSPRMHDLNPYLIYSSLPETRHFARAEGTYATLEAAQAAASPLIRAGREVVIAREEWRAGKRVRRDASRVDGSHLGVAQRG
jgi:hypothetical protein